MHILDGILLGVVTAAAAYQLARIAARTEYLVRSNREILELLKKSTAPLITLQINGKTFGPLEMKAEPNPPKTDKVN
jgi:hypothetical protein